MLEKELESSSSCEKDVTVKTPHRTPINSPLKYVQLDKVGSSDSIIPLLRHSMAPFSPSSYFINAPLSSSTPRHLRGSPRKRHSAEKENFEVNVTPRLPHLGNLANLANLADRGLPKKDLLNLTPKRTVPFVPRTPTPFKVNILFNSWTRRLTIQLLASNCSAGKATWNAEQYAWRQSRGPVRGKKLHL